MNLKNKITNKKKGLNQLRELCYLNLLNNKAKIKF